MIVSNEDFHAERRIRAAYMEIAAQMQWLADEKPLSHPFWEDLHNDIASLYLARTLFNEGRYIEAVDALPEF
jgi:hypothetical protein